MRDSFALSIDFNRSSINLKDTIFGPLTTKRSFNFANKSTTLNNIIIKNINSFNLKINKKTFYKINSLNA